MASGGERIPMPNGSTNVDMQEPEQSAPKDGRNPSETKKKRSKKRMRKDDSGLSQESEDSSEGSSHGSTSSVKTCDQNPSLDSGNLGSFDMDTAESTTQEIVIDSSLQIHKECSQENSVSMQSIPCEMDAANSAPFFDSDTPEEMAASATTHVNSRHNNYPVDAVIRVEEQFNVEVDSDVDGAENDGRASNVGSRGSSISELDIQPNVNDEKYDPTPNVPRPTNKWFAPKAVIGRQYGQSSSYSPDIFRYKAYGSLQMVEHLELMYKLKMHDGCVNSLHFNAEGTLLVTGSDDRFIVIWEWTIGQALFKFPSGHRSNIFQTKFLPNCNNHRVVSCARDGQVRVCDIYKLDRECTNSKRVGLHKGSAHKLSLITGDPNRILSCGEDSVVLNIDLRMENPDKILTCKRRSKKVPLYSIQTNPYKPYEFAVAGRDPYVRVYDIRVIKENDKPLASLCPEHLVDSESANVTSVVYNYNGKEILASYNDDDIYLFEDNKNKKTEYTHRYRGHRNSQTVKGVNFFGAYSEHVISGSDCGNIFVWEKETGHVVNCMYGDETGVVNCLEPHPNMPVLATSGLDSDIKIWIPSCEDEPNLRGLKKKLIKNMMERDIEQEENLPNALVDQTIWILMQHLAGARNRVRESQGEAESPELSPESTTSDSEDDSPGSARPVQCAQS